MNRGVKGTVVSAVQKVGERLRLRKSDETVESLEKGAGGPEVHPFDLEHGTDTSGMVWGEFLESGHKNDLWSTAYYGVAPSLLTSSIESLGIDCQKFTFVDLGSGKGRGMLLASRFPFRKIVGVEFVAELSTAAAENIAHFSPDWKQCSAIEAINGDATEFQYPPGPLVVYLYNPFLSPVLKRCIKHLNDTLKREPREVHLLYINPAFQHIIRKHARGFELQWQKDFIFTHEEAAADKFGTSDECVMAWKFSG
jgi:hypothetical protein